MARSRSSEKSRHRVRNVAASPAVTPVADKTGHHRTATRRFATARRRATRNENRAAFVFSFVGAPARLSRDLTRDNFDHNLNIHEAFKME
jgi:transcriptional regulator of met regulon